uniref:Nucleophosmin 1a n=1 Tax=Astyanax mexicanus TaxID=7994 RepID=A0A8B9KN36_ASTMX
MALQTITHCGNLTLDLKQLGQSTSCCELKQGKEVTFNPEDDDFEHQLSIRMVCVDPATKDELNIVEVEGQDSEGQKVKAVLATLKPSTLPSVCLGGFEIAPPVVFRLRSGAGPIHISGQHLVSNDTACTSQKQYSCVCVLLTLFT